jgi:hypothetical protein
MNVDHWSAAGRARNGQPRPHAVRHHGLLARAVAGAALALAILASPAQAAPLGAVDTGPCVAFDALGYRYIAFGRTGVAEPGVYLATNRSGSWRITKHPISPGNRCVDMLVDTHRYIHLLAYESSPDEPFVLTPLWYVTDRSGTWRHARVYNNEVDFASLAIDRSGRPNVGLIDQEGYWLYQRSANGRWAARLAGDGSISHIRRDSAGRLWAVNQDLDRRRMTRLTDASGTWQVRRVATPYAGRRDIDLVVDQAGRRFLFAYDPANGRVGIYRGVDNGWVSTGQTRAYPDRILRSAELEPAGAPHLMLFFGRTRGEWGIIDMNRHDGVWHTQLIGYGSFEADMAIDARGRVAAAFDRDGVVWSYWNDWKGAPHRFAVSSL